MDYEIVAETTFGVIEYCFSSDIYYTREKSEKTRRVASLDDLKYATWYNEQERQSALS